MPTDLKGLNNFMRRLEKVKQLETVKDKASSNVADKGVELARAAYIGMDISRAEVSKEPSDNGDYAVVAQGDGLAFEEYGTGYYAKGTYKGELPQTGVPITGKWEHYYDSKFKDEVDGKKGWWTSAEGQGTFMIGEYAGNQMYYTSVELGEQAPKIVDEIVKELLK